ncbi:MAG TPA: glycosyl hydrolase [Micromonosporaceae bacterium]
MTARPTTVMAAVAGAVVAVGTMAACAGEIPKPVRPDPSASGSATPAVSPSARPVPFPPAGKVFLGVQTNLGPYDFAAVDAFTAATRHQPSVLQFSQGWAEDQFDAARFTAIAARGMLPVVSWEPWDYRLRGRASSHGEQREYRLAAIADGSFDPYIRSWAAGIAALPFPVVIRFAHEMNGFWYPWCEQSNGNRPGDYVRAWRHVHRLFSEAGATNVTWLWSPNVTYAGATPLKRLYPGDAFVDWVGLSGYYGTAGRTSYLSFGEVFNATIKQLRTFTGKPVVVTETGATDATGQRARWIAEMFAQLPRHREIIGVIWFEATKEIDWRIAVAPAAAGAYARGAADSRYDTPWGPEAVPRRR